MLWVWAVTKVEPFVANQNPLWNGMPCVQIERSDGGEHVNQWFFFGASVVWKRCL